jgi:3-oxoacyl-[acyl-carrier protein] reductase
MDLGLQGKVALITGGSRGIGRGTAHVLSREGVRVAICSRNEDTLTKTADEISADTGNEVLAIPADLTVLEEQRWEFHFCLLR